MPARLTNTARSTSKSSAIAKDGQAPAWPSGKISYSTDELQGMNRLQLTHPMVLQDDVADGTSHPFNEYLHLIQGDMYVFCFQWNTAGRASDAEHLADKIRSQDWNPLILGYEASPGLMRDRNIDWTVLKVASPNLGGWQAYRLKPGCTL